MRKLDRLILTELLGPFLFGVAIFTVLIMAGSFLFQMTNYIVRGISVSTVMWLIFLLLPGIMAKTFPMAMLLSALLAFGRLSGDSEITAIRAAGTSLTRIMVPVAGFGLAVTLLAFGFNEALVPPASLEATRMREGISRQLEGTALQPTSYAVTRNGKLEAYVVARDFDSAARVLRGATLIAYDDEGRRTMTMDAAELQFTDENEWRIRGEARVYDPSLQYTAVLRDGAWPVQIPRPTMRPTDILAQNLRDLDALSMTGLWRVIEAERAKPNANPRQIRNLEYGYWNKVALPLAALVYALLGAPLGIRAHRTGTATGFALAIVIIFAYFLFANVLGVTAQGGALSPAMAAFLPVLIGLGAAGWITHVKNK